MATNKKLIEEVNNMTLSELRVSYYPRVRNSDRPQITHSAEAYKLFLDKWDMDSIHMIEQSYLLLLNRASRVLGIKQISMGGVSGTVLDPRVVFRYALVAGATALMIAHNHPSGNLHPSKSDELITRKLKEIAMLHDMQLMDHLVITTEGYFSFADEGLL
ncbi:MAG: JAB domain-containing protein [Sediminibacterium sp.]